MDNLTFENSNVVSYSNNSSNNSKLMEEEEQTRGLLIPRPERSDPGGRGRGGGVPQEPFI